MSITVTGNSNQTGRFSMSVEVVTGANLANTLGQTAIASAQSASITPLGNGSIIFGSEVTLFGGAYTPVSGTTIIQDVTGGSTEDAQLYATGTAKANPVTVGATSVGGSSPVLCLAEILADGTMAIDASSPPAIPGNGVGTDAVSSLTTAAFTPPDGAVLVAMLGQQAGSAVFSITDTSGGIYTWTQAAFKTNATGSVTIFVGVPPLPGPVPWEGQVNSFADGVAPDAIGFIPNVPAPETLLPEITHDDESWIADNATRARGIQPVTSTNPDGDVPGIPFSVRPSDD